MKIGNISISDLGSGHLCTSMENIYHVKSLPCLSIVQAVQGHYDIKIQDSPEYRLEEADVFVAPPNKTQHIRHHDSKISGIMKAHWVFYNVIINNEFYLTDIYEFPVYIPRKYNQQIMDIISSFAASDIFIQYAKALEITDILMKTGHRKSIENNDFLRLKSYILNHIYDNDALTPDRLCSYLNTSPATFYRNFKKWFGVTSGEYIKNERLDRVAFLLETTDLAIGAICDKTGFYDNSQLDLLFKSKFGVSPSEYRKSMKFRRSYTEESLLC